MPEAKLMMAMNLVKEVLNAEKFLRRRAKEILHTKGTWLNSIKKKKALGMESDTR